MAEQEKEISNYEFKDFSISSVNKDAVEEYSFLHLNERTPFCAEKNDEKTKFERISAEKKNFIISPIVKEHRGLLDQEKKERERKILDEVSRRIEIIKQGAYEDGFNEGVDAGEKEVFNQTKAETEEKLNILTEMINEVLVVKESIIMNQKDEIYKLIRNLTKWVILRELKDDGEYISRLLEKLIIETQETSNLLVQVNQKQFSAMPEIIEVVQNKLGKLDNVRVEVDYEISENGIVIDSDNGIISGTLDQQFESLDKLFDTVIPDE